MLLLKTSAQIRRSLCLFFMSFLAAIPQYIIGNINVLKTDNPELINLEEQLFNGNFFLINLFLSFLKKS